MNTTILLIHDIHFPYQLFESALEWAKEQETEFRVIFLTHETILIETDELLIETDDTNGHAYTPTDSTRQVIAQHLRFLQRRATACHLPFRSIILVSPTLQQVVEHTRDADKVFVEYRDAALFNDFLFSREELLRRIPGQRLAVA